MGEIEVEKAYMVAMTAHTSTYDILCCTGTNFHKSLQTCPLWKAIAPLLRHDEQLLVLAGAESVCKVQSAEREMKILSFFMGCSNINFVKLKYEYHLNII